ncbi:MAG: heme-binding protein [Gammaproteobacteria bacterium]|jgi:uncharacterized protein GlcG (DUF336 family)|nr:heme-binding protein [Gammaproteobacteria bacterium]
MNRFVIGLLSLLLLSCSSGEQKSAEGTGVGAADCAGRCASASTFLSIADVQRIIAQAVNEASARGARATIAVTDRVGNVLGVFRMTGAAPDITIPTPRGVTGGLNGITIIPDTMAAISKAVTGAYLSSEGNAFSTRTASQIVQENFNPGEIGQPAGPLFGVQFSNLACSDLNNRFPANGFGAGPFRSPLGLAADPGGFPLYKQGTPVGGIGVIADGVYGLDENVGDRDQDLDELIAMAGSYSFAAPINRRERVTLDGKIARFSDIDFDDLVTHPPNAPGYASIIGVSGLLADIPAYFLAAGGILTGTAFGQSASGIRPDSGNYPGADAFVLVDNTNAVRYPPIAGSDGANALTANEARQLVRSALVVAKRARAQIRLPLSSPAQVSVSIVDTNGVVLAQARTRDAPIFGTDVSLQKARTATFFSSANAAAALIGAPSVTYLDAAGTTITIGDYVTAARSFLGSPTALADGAFAFADRSGGNLSRPFFPDGLNGNVNGPFSKPYSAWSPFSTGLQLDLAFNQLVGHVVHVRGGGADPDQNCTGNFGGPGTIGQLANGLQIFPGSVPIYRGNTLVGGIGVSGDGVDQDDMIAFLGLHEAGQVLGTINNAPPGMRADQLQPQGTRLRFVQCPQSPYLNSSAAQVCDGK